ncbi:MAG TPA: hypothetical protein VMO26_16230, partial [Vicinamibacterales bacterium]|nr:hypothetical protein [Vicinamibacterales bacterium]
NDALLVAGRLLRNGGKSMLFTDADSHPTGATTAAVSALYTSKSLRMSVLLSGRCTGPAFDGSSAVRDADGMDPRDSQNPDAGDGEFATDRLPPEPTLGTESSIETNAAIARATGGMFAAIPGIKSGDVTETTRYINTGTNIAVSASIPTVGLVTPGDGPRATTIDIDIEGSTTNFQSSSVVTFAGTGITVNSRTVKSPTVITANVTIAADAALGFRDVTVTTELGGGTVESATGVGAFNVTTTPTSPTILSVSPNSLGPGQTVDVTIKGINTNFTNASMPVFCVSTFCTSTGGHDTNVVLNAITPVDATTVIVNLTIDTDAIIGYRSVSVITGSEVARETVVGPFLIAPTAADIAALTSVTPASGSIGQTLTIDVVGANTNFVNGTSALSFSGTGITVNSTTVTSPTTVSASITIDAGATPGFRDIFVTTDGESAALLNGFNVLGSVPTAQPATGLYVASVVGNLVTLRFTPPAFGLPPDNYVLEGGINPGEVLASIATNSAYPIFTFIAPTGAFYVRMHTLSGASRSGPSNEIRLYVNVPAPPSPPASLTGTVDGTSLTLSWRNTFEGGAPQSHLLDVTGAAVATLPLPLGEQFSFIGVPGGTYTLRVRSVNAGGVSAASDPVTLSFPGACSGVPVAPTSFLASRMGNLVKVDWEPPASGPAPTGFTLIVTGTFNLTIPTTGRTLQGEVPSGVYNLSVRGINSCGLGVVTAVQTIVVP